MNAMSLKALRKAISLFDNEKHFCEAINISYQQLWNWINREGQVPVYYCKVIERVTHGKVTKEDLRPDIYG